MNQNRIVAVIVSYRPEQDVLSRLLDSLTGQVEAILIVDNGSPAECVEAIKARGRATERVLELGENLGIAAAQNRGMAEARRLGASHVVLFDHDSHPEQGMIAELLACCETLQRQGRRVGAIGPDYIDPRQGEVPVFVQVRGCRLLRVPRGEEAWVEVDHVIASGTLIPLEALDAVGDMDESLFIDYVDVEWCLRARHRGFPVYGCYSARMLHSLGDDPVVFLGKARPVRSPIRHYYMFRNAMLLYRMKHIPLSWKIADFLHFLPRFGFYALFAKPRAAQLKMMLLGIWHGLRGKRGKFGLVS